MHLEVRDFEQGRNWLLQKKNCFYYNFTKICQILFTPLYF